MELKGLCSICRRSATMFTCQFCGRLVCINCFDPIRGICIQCSRGRSFGSMNQI